MCDVLLSGGRIHITVSIFLFDLPNDSVASRLDQHRNWPPILLIPISAIQTQLSKYGIFRISLYALGYLPMILICSISYTHINHDIYNYSFVGVCEWERSKDTPIGNPDSYGSIGAACGFASTPYTTPVVLFYRRDKWSLEASYPPSSNCRDNVPVPNATGSFVGPQIGPVCVDKVTPGEYDCCSCSFSEDEYNKGSAMGQSLGQRAWAGGLFKMKDVTYEGDESPKICVVTGEFPHPLSNQTLWDLNGEVVDSDPKPYSIMRYICTSLLNPENCIPNLSGTSNILLVPIHL